jgi:hypothetical protein
LVPLHRHVISKFIKGGGNPLISLLKISLVFGHDLGLNILRNCGISKQGHRNEKANWQSAIFHNHPWFKLSREANYILVQGRSFKVFLNF